ncbi:MAG: hypothetical protein H0X69_02940 [Gemmatimonadales bacterium]|nr:hypothetical protein [Gemmatimonadales bacterium]
MRRLLFVGLLALWPAMAAAQASQFGVRGLGVPGRSLSTRAAGSSGAFGMFDAESGLNPAALSALVVMTANFNGTQSFRTAENPAGSESLRDSRFPHVAFGGPVPGTPLVVGLSYSTYANRDFTIASSDTLELRDVLVPVSDTLSSRGGLSDLRLAAAYKLRSRTAVGGAFHVITGSNRLESRRTFSDDQYLPVQQSAELSYAGVGVALGAVQQVGEGLWVAAIARSDGKAIVDRDSARVSQVDLPYTLGLGVRYRVGSRLDLATHGIFRTWSGANSDLLASGGTGADNTFEAAIGGEYIGDPRRPYRRPIRFGARYATLPFPLQPGVQPTEFAVSIGSGVRFAQDRAGIDLSVEHLWRSAGDFEERAFVVFVGVGVRP